MKSHQRKRVPFDQVRFHRSVDLFQRDSQNALHAFAIFIFSCILSSQVLADEIILRNFVVLSDVTVEQVDPDGIRLDDGRLISLGSVKSATLSKQKEFDQLFQKFGDPLFRIRIRLEKNDYENLGKPLATLLPVYNNRTSQSAALVQVANFRHHVEQGRNVLAIQSHFRLFALAQKNSENAKAITALKYPISASDGLSPWVTPFNLDNKTIVENWEAIVASYASMPTSHPSGLDYYFLAMAQAGGIVPAEMSAAKSKLSAAEHLDLAAQKILISSPGDNGPQQIDVNGLIQKYLNEDSRGKRSPIRIATGLYLLGQLQLLSEEIPKSDGLLSLLRVHSEIGDAAPSISAGALSATQRFLRDKLPAKDAKSISKELLSRYPSSIFAKRFRMLDKK